MLDLVIFFLNILTNRSKKVRGEGLFITNDFSKVNLVLAKKASDKYFANISIQNLNRNNIYNIVIIKDTEFYFIKTVLKAKDIFTFRIWNECKCITNDIKIIYESNNAIYMQKLIDNRVLSKPKKISIRMGYKTILNNMFKNFFKD